MCERERERECVCVSWTLRSMLVVDGVAAAGKCFSLKITRMIHKLWLYFKGRMGGWICVRFDCWCGYWDESLRSVFLGVFVVWYPAEWNIIVKYMT